MQNVQMDLGRIVSTVIIYIVGSNVGIDKTLALIVLMILNTVIWILLKEMYGTTVGKILVKQLRELLVMFSLIFATKLVATAMGFDALTVAVYWAFVARLIFFLLYMAKRELGKNELDTGGRVNNMIFAKLFKLFGEAFNLNSDMADIDDSLKAINTPNLKKEKDIVKNFNIDKDVEEKPNNNEGNNDHQGGQDNE